jgi:YggT family protein
MITKCSTTSRRTEAGDFLQDCQIKLKVLIQMYIVGFFLKAVANVLDLVLLFYMWVVIARAVLSWVNPDPYNPIVRFIHNVTEPVLYQVRKKIPINFGGIDFSPIIVILVVYFLRDFAVNSLVRFSKSLL